MKSLSIILGRAPQSPDEQIKSKEAYLKKKANKVVTWYVDVEINSPKVSRQHAMIAYNFENRSFQLINLSHKHKIKLNGDKLSPGSAPVNIESRDIITIGEESFAFLLPVKIPKEEEAKIEA